MNNIFDIAIIGAGLNGICIAENLDKKKFRICLIETGGVDNLSNLHNYIVKGHPEGIKTVNDYKFGGGHNVWHGLLARLDLDEIDENIWCESSEKMGEYYDQAEEYLGLSKSIKKENEKLIYKDLIKSGLNKLKYKVFHQVDVKFDRHRKLNELIKSGVKILLDHTVINIDKKENSHYIVNVINGNKVLARKIILSSNAIYNPIILMRSKSIIFNNELVGKYLSDHPMGVIGKIQFEERHRFPLCLIRKKYNINFSKIGFSIKDEQLNLTHTFYVVPTLEKKFSSANSTIRKSLIKIRDSGFSMSLMLDLIKNFDMILFVISYKFGLMFNTRFADLLVVSEQNLSNNNKVSINDANQVVKNWVIEDKLVSSIHISAGFLAQKINKIYQVKSIDILPSAEMLHELTSAAHLCCTTKMKNKNGDGVVDGDLKLIGPENIYIAGASVFPIAMSLNNTLTALALSFKLVAKLNQNRIKST